MTDKATSLPLAASHPDHPVLSGEQLLELARMVSQAIESCGAGIELTTAVTLSSDLSHHLQRFIDQQDAKRIISTADNYACRYALRKMVRELDACQKVIHLRGGFDPAYVRDAQAALKEAEILLSEQPDMQNPEQLRHERDMLAEAIENAAAKAGITAPGAQLTGPMLLMLCDDLAELCNSVADHSCQEDK